MTLKYNRKDISVRVRYHPKQPFMSVKTDAGAVRHGLHGGAVVAALGEDGEGGVGECLLALGPVDDAGHGSVWPECT